MNQFNFPTEAQSHDICTNCYNPLDTHVFSQDEYTDYLTCPQENRMQDIKTAIEAAAKAQAEVDAQPKPTLAEGVTVKVSDSRKCISIYNVAGNRMPGNFTIEQWDCFTESYLAIHAFVEENRDVLLTRSERKFENDAARKQARADEEKSRNLSHGVDLAQLAQVLKLMQSLKQAG